MCFQCHEINGIFFPAAVFNATFDASGLMEINHGANHTSLEWKKGQFERLKAFIRQACFDDSARRNAQALYETKLQEFCCRHCPSWDEEVEEVEEVVSESSKQDAKTEEERIEEEKTEEEKNEENSDSESSSSDASSESSEEAPVESSNNTSPASSPVSKAAVLDTFQGAKVTEFFEQQSEASDAFISDDELFESLEESYSEFKKSYTASSKAPVSNEAASFAYSPNSGSLPSGHGWLYNNGIYTIPEEDEPEEMPQTEKFNWTLTTAPGATSPRCEPECPNPEVSGVQKLSGGGHSEVMEVSQSETLQANLNQDCSPNSGSQKPDGSDPSPSSSTQDLPASTNSAYCLEDFPFFRHVLAQSPKESFLPGDFFKFRELCYPKKAATFLPGECFRLWSLRATKRGPRRSRRRARA
ncbi:uncharacterized protein CXQ87_001236 [Candidozyma duobushaemuli]|uniref:Uncharacterized protein n=2 Tax=Candidozyma TaxID=3303203 RepID=A0ABX8I196_9ASCO|nr:uncharacterized protein CXQ87_001236 [[Candida] duobushaemulonis]PVH18316.1 hypothetical protein CXQ87_001236 [[Candida] duobushaemulonis]QWU86864.1 hypothetical protein CA3LBN_001082 [[Candida] haemuloni]